MPLFARTAFALVAACALSIPIGTPAAAAPPQPESARTGYSVSLPDGSQAWVGSYTVEGAAVYCIDAQSPSPNTSADYSSALATSLRRQVSDGSISGSYLTKRQLGQLSYILSHYGRSSDPIVAAAVENADRLLTNGDATQERRQEMRWDTVTDAHPRADETFEQIWSESKALAGPYTIDMAGVIPKGEDSGSMRVRVLSAAGNPVPMVPVTLSAKGGTVTRSIVTDKAGNGVARLARDGVDEIKVSATAKQLSNDYPMLHTPKGFNKPQPRVKFQRMIGAAPRTSIQHKLTIKAGKPRPSVVPTVDGETSQSITRAGKSIHDDVTVAGTADGYQATAVARLFGPFEEHPTSQDCVDESGRVNFRVDGDGEYRTPSIIVTSPGYYTWVVTLPGTSRQASVSTACGELDQTTIVRAKTAIDVETSDPAIISGDSISAIAIVADAAPGFEGQATLRLFGPIPEDPSADSCSGPEAAVRTIAVDGDGTYKSTPVALDAPGYYSWIAELPGSPTQDDARSQCGAPGATTIVRAEPSLGIDTSAPQSAPGHEIYARASISDMFPEEPTTVKVRLYGPLAETPTSQDCEGTPVHTFSASVDRDGTVDSSSFSPRFSGYYVWQATLAPTEFQESATTPCTATSARTLAERESPGDVKIPTGVTRGGSTMAPRALTGEVLSARAQNIEARIVPTEIVKGELLIPAPSEVARWSAGARLGDKRGTIVLAGHVTDPEGKPGALGRLHKMEVGQAFVVKDANGRSQRFEITKKSKSPLPGPVPASKLSQSGPLRLTIVTCADPVKDDWKLRYRNNLIVQAKPIRK